nr:uncharacterized protein LOC117983968 [Maniola hyperantus]
MKTKGLNFALTPRNIPIESIVCSIEDTIVRNSIPAREAECLRQDIATFLRRAKLPQSNINREDRTALLNIRNNKDILILPADKGNATVIVDTEVYEDKINQLLSDTNTYKKVNYNPTARTTNRIIKLLQALNDKNLLSQLRPHNSTSPKIYGLPKIHKLNWPLRPIVSQIDSPTYKVSRHMATILKPFTGNTSSHVRDSRHFVHLIKNETISDTEIMVSFDVESLFTNIPVDEASQLISDFLKKSGAPTGYLDLSEFCLKNGYFSWRGDYYLQVDGVAMGSPIAPVAANIFMEWVEGELVEMMPEKPRRWLRYVDDIFAIVNKEELSQVFQNLNGLHRKVHFTIEEEKEGHWNITVTIGVKVIDWHTTLQGENRRDQSEHPDESDGTHTQRQKCGHQWVSNSRTYPKFGYVALHTIRQGFRIVPGKVSSTAEDTGSDRN